MQEGGERPYAAHRNQTVVSSHSFCCTPAPHRASAPLALSSVTQLPRHWPSAFSLVPPIHSPHPREPDVLEQTPLPSGGRTFYLYPHDPLLSPCIPCSVSQDFPWFPDQAAFPLVSKLGSCCFLPLPPVCVASFLLDSAQVTSSRKPSQPCEGHVLSVALCHTAYLWNYSRLPSARPSFCHWGSHVQVQSCHHRGGLAATGVGGRNHEVKVGYLYPQDPVISRIFFFYLGFRMFQIINPGAATSFSPPCQESPRPSTHQ